MTEAEGRGVQLWIRIANSAMCRMSREQAREILEELPESSLADLMEVASAAGVAVNGENGGNLLYEVAAAALRELDEATERTRQ